MTPRSIAVVGSGMAGLSAAWLLATRHRVTLFERDHRPGGHSNTVDVDAPEGRVGVDTGFIVYNPRSYPNLVALFDHLGVVTAPTNMSFAVSLDQGAYEYSGSGLGGLMGQRRNLASPQHWRMIAGLLRFLGAAACLAEGSADPDLSLGEFLAQNRFPDALVRNHLLPMGAAIWSAPNDQILQFPAVSFAKFFANHGLLRVRGRPPWRTVKGGARSYVERLLEDFPGAVRLAAPVVQIERRKGGVRLGLANGRVERFDHVVIACHADDALALLGDADGRERGLLGAFGYTSNLAVLHGDETLMPKRRRIWSSWNFLGESGGNPPQVCVSYWMNSLQPLATSAQYFVTLNPVRPVAESCELGRFRYEHPRFDARAIAAQGELWSLQGRRNTWFCGSYFGYGFHEDALQSGLAVAEQLGGVRRPWVVPGESDRIHAGTGRAVERMAEAAE